MALLGDVCEVKQNYPEADFWLPCRGPNMGKPIKTFDPTCLGVKVTATDKLVPQYLYYWFEYIHGQGAYKDMAVLRARDVKNIEMEFRE